MKELELIVLSLLTAFAVVLIFGAYVYPKFESKNPYNRRVMNIFLRVLIWSLVYAISVVVFAMGSILLIENF